MGPDSMVRTGWPPRQLHTDRSLGSYRAALKPAFEKIFLETGWETSQNNLAYKITHPNFM